MISKDAKTYNEQLPQAEREICDLLARLISEGLPQAVNKVWHAHPVWFLDGNPIVGYSKLKGCIRLLFWSGQSFEEEALKKEGSFKAAEIRYTSAGQVAEDDLKRWLSKAETIQWDYANIVKRKGKLEILKMGLILCLSICLSFKAGLLNAQPGTWQAGIEGGPGFSIIYGKNSVYSGSGPSLAGVAGIFGEYGFAGDLSVKAALHYERVGTRLGNKSAILPPGGILQYNLDYLSLPLLVKWNFGGRIRFFVNAGPTLSLLLNESLIYLPESGSKGTVDDEPGTYNPVLLSVTAGAGVALPVGKRFVVTLELRDNFGITDIRSAVSDFESNSYVITGDVTGHTNSTLILAGVSYRIGGSKGMPCAPNDPEFQYIRKK